MLNFDLYSKETFHNLCYIFHLLIIFYFILCYLFHFIYNKKVVYSFNFSTVLVIKYFTMICIVLYKSYFELAIIKKIWYTLFVTFIVIFLQVFLTFIIILCICLYIFVCVVGVILVSIYFYFSSSFHLFPFNVCAST